MAVRLFDLDRTKIPARFAFIKTGVAHLLFGKFDVNAIHDHFTRLLMRSNIMNTTV